jgi:hypothetical protein
VSGDKLLGFTLKQDKQSPAPSVVYLPGCGQVVRTIPTWKAPEGVFPKGIFLVCHCYMEENVSSL